MTAECAERRGGRYNECEWVGGNDGMCRSEAACVAAAGNALDFERAIKLRDAVKKLKVQAAER